MKKVLIILLTLQPLIGIAQPAPLREPYDLTKGRTLYAIGYTHLDTQWNWDYPTTIDRYIKCTMTDNFALFEKYPDFVFNFTGSRRYEMMVAANGDLTSIYDKKAGKELLARPASLEFLRESPAQWPAWNMDWADRQKPPIGTMSDNVFIKVVENGPVRVALEIGREGEYSKIVQSDKPDDSTLRLTLMYTPVANVDRFTYQATQDFGIHDFKYGIYGHSVGEEVVPLQKLYADFEGYPRFNLRRMEPKPTQAHR